MNGVGTIQMLLLAILMFCGIAGLAGSFITPLVVRWTAAWSPASRHRAMIILGAAPLVLGAAAVTSVMLPSLLGMHWPAQDHCLVHGGHSHLCFVHAAHGWGSWSGWFVIAAALGLVVTRVVRAGRVLRTASGLIDELSDCARLDVEHGIWIVASNGAFCLSAGLWRPRLIVSEGLLRSSSADELEVILAHEHAHVRRMDSFVRVMARAVTILLLPHARQQLLGALELAAEQACDEEAVSKIGDRLRVAETILAMERRLARSSFVLNPMVAGFGSSSVPARVESMLQPQRKANGCPVISSLLAGAVVAVLGAHDFLHHATESLLAVLSH